MALKPYSEDVSGYILAGGKSRRMGFDKRKIIFDGVTLLDRANQLLIDVLNKQPTIIGDNLDWLDKHDHRILNDAKPNCGPLGGLVTALRDCSTRWALVIACDFPLLNSLIFRELFKDVNEKFDVVALSSSKGIEPLIALYNKSTRGFWENRLICGEYKLISGINQLNYLASKITQTSVLRVNINTVNDLPKG